MPNTAHAKRGLRRRIHALKRRAASHAAGQQPHLTSQRDTTRAHGGARLRSPAELRSIDKMHQELEDIANPSVDTLAA